RAIDDVLIGALVLEGQRSAGLVEGVGGELKNNAVAAGIGHIGCAGEIGDRAVGGDMQGVGDGVNEIAGELLRSVPLQLPARKIDGAVSVTDSLERIDLKKACLNRGRAGVTVERAVSTRPERQIPGARLG